MIVAAGEAEGDIWPHMLELFARGHSLIRSDARGNGRSDWQPSAITFDSFVSDLATVFDAAGVERAPVFGISQGAAVDGTLQAQAQADADYLCMHGTYTPEQERAIRQLLVKACGWQHIASGVQHGQFATLLSEMCTPGQLDRVQRALEPLLG